MYNYEKTYKRKRIMNELFAFVTLGIMIFIVMLLFREMAGYNLNYDNYSIEAEVVGKIVNVDQETTYIKSGDVLLPMTSAHTNYSVDVKYEELVDTIKDKSLYYRVEVGDNVSCFLVRGYDKKTGKLKRKYISLTERR